MNWELPLLGGILIGLSASILLLFFGRVSGISGILNSSITFDVKNSLWRYIFLLGFIFGGICMGYIFPSHISIANQHWSIYLAAGLFVGLGTAMANGCTSGHAVCGISRRSTRSLLATCIFIFSGMLTTWLIRGLWNT